MLKRLSWMIGVVAVANAAALMMVAGNRSGVPDAALRLTEREMRLTNMGTDTTGMTLTLRWDRDTPTPWFDRAKLASIGFDCSMPPDAPDAPEHYSGPWLLPRRTNVVLVYEPDKIAVEAPSPVAGDAPPAQASEYRSRLRPVDVGNDPRTLRVQYGDRHRYLITAGAAGIHFTAAVANRPARLEGRVLWVDPVQVYVPQEMQRVVAGAVALEGRRQALPSPLTRPPRYEVTIEYGSRLLPRIVGIRMLSNGS